MTAPDRPDLQFRVRLHDVVDELEKLAHRVRNTENELDNGDTPAEVAAEIIGIVTGGSLSTPLTNLVKAASRAAAIALQDSPAPETPTQDGRSIDMQSMIIDNVRQMTAAYGGDLEGACRQTARVFRADVDYVRKLVAPTFKSPRTSR